MQHKFVEFIPDELENKVLYISIPYATVVHLCCCGCGREVVTPLTPFDWQLTFDGKTITLYPSIGNWGFPCQSHYWIRNSEVKWAEAWSKDMIRQNRKKSKDQTDEHLRPKTAWKLLNLFKKKRRHE